MIGAKVGSSISPAATLCEYCQRSQARPPWPSPAVEMMTVSGCERFTMESVTVLKSFRPSPVGQAWISSARKNDTLRPCFE